ncbi:uncharacterized protein LOC105432969 [Pogonomyrmex barbatus]|uniref:Uncharacterized protein LOC105432969 n=1 Tax=Pogonomyrmex barbatus TaxID=144034 RepID=A0A6I9WUS7_9HYME|nr:uncharacterized protein LOC105432969 [Pogonomyrmex barbatus]
MVVTVNGGEHAIGEKIDVCDQKVARDGFPTTIHAPFSKCTRYFTLANFHGVLSRAFSIVIGTGMEIRVAAARCRKCGFTTTMRSTNWTAAITWLLRHIAPR